MKATIHLGVWCFRDLKSEFLNVCKQGIYAAPRYWESVKVACHAIHFLNQHLQLQQVTTTTDVDFRCVYWENPGVSIVWWIKSTYQCSVYKKTSIPHCSIRPFVASPDATDCPFSFAAPSQHLVAYGRVYLYLCSPDCGWWHKSPIISCYT